MENKTTRVLNLTPLTFRNGATGAYLRPLEQGVEWPSGKISLLDEVAGLIHSMEHKEQDFIIDPDFFLRNQWNQMWPMPYKVLEVQNNSSRFVNTYRLAAPNGQTEQLQSIAPGKNRQFNVGLFEIWSFRATFTNELVGIARIGFTNKVDWSAGIAPAPTLRLTLTDEFVENWRAYQSRTATDGALTKSPDDKLGPSFTPRRIIGEQRSSTSPPDDLGFLTATDLRHEFSKEAFNGRGNRVVRDIEIAGVLLRWGGSNHVLADYYGEDKDDIRSLTIYADRMEVADHLRFPRTNVTIYARELAFTSEVSSIDTTPLGNPNRARSEFFTEEDPDDPTNGNFPADKKNGRTTYKARDGEKGEQGGTITLYVGEVFDTAGDAGTKRFICRGGKGQAAEAGGLKKYVQQPGYPENYGASQTVSADDVKKLLEDRLSGIRRPRRLWPGGEGSPNKLTYDSPEVNPLNAGQVVAVTLMSDFLTDRGHLPNPQWLSNDKPNPAPKPCNGREAYPGGWPGDGGNGGAIKIHLGNGNVPDSACDVGPGEAGNPTSAVEGGIPPGPLPAYALEISVITAGERSLSEHGPTNQPKLTQKIVTGKNGEPAKSRRIVSDAAAAPKDCEVKRSDAKRGEIEQNPAADPSWAHPNVVCAVLRYARTAYRNGFRDDAALALDPYYALIGADGSPKSTIGLDGNPKPIDERLRMALVSVTAMRNNQIRNLDYYGHPPGWVPRLNALSNLQVLNAVRETAYETFYFADKLLRDYDELDDTREVSQRMSGALKAELNAAKNTLQTAYDNIPKSLQELMEVQGELEPIKNDIEALKNWANLKTEKLKGTIQAQRIYSSAMQILGGIAKCLPVGQPFVGLAGSAFEAASQVDWNAEDPLKTARSAINSFSDDVTEVMKDKKKQVARLLTKDLSNEHSKRKDSITSLTDLLEDVTKEPEDKTKSIEKGWKDFKLEASNELVDDIENANADLKQIDQLLLNLNNEIAELIKSAKDVKGKEKLTKSEKQRTKLEERRKSTQETIKNLKAEVTVLKDDKLKRLSGLAEYRRKLAQTEEEARKRAEAADEPENKKIAEARAKKLEELRGELTAAKETNQKQKKLIAKRQETVKDVMTNLEGLGSGLSLIGNGIVSLVTPLTPADPTWKRLAEQMVHDDPELQHKARQLELNMREVLERKRHKVEELLRWQQVASASIATITSTLGALTELSRQRQSIDQGLNPAVKGHLEDTKERARDILGESIYWFVKSYQYEFLGDVDDTFYNFDAWTEKIQELERTKKATMAADAGDRSNVSLGKPKTVVLDDTEFRQVGDGVFKAETLKLGANLLRTRQTRGEKLKGVYRSCVIERTLSEELTEQQLNWGVVARENTNPDKQVWMNEMLDRLLKEGQVSFNFVRDFEKGSFQLNDARVVNVRLTAFAITTDDPNLSLTIRVAHSGQSVLAKRTVDGGREFFSFQSGKGDEPIFWQFVYNHSEPSGQRLSQMLSADIVTENVKALFNEKLARSTFHDYSPGLFSDYLVEITDLKEKRSKIKAINKLAMDVTISQGG